MHYSSRILAFSMSTGIAMIIKRSRKLRKTHKKDTANANEVGCAQRGSLQPLILQSCLLLLKILRFLLTGTHDHGAVNAIIDDFPTVTVLNNKSFYLDCLSQTSSVGLISVGSNNHKPTHIGTATMSIRDNNEKLHAIKIPKALCFRCHQ